jgi:hypothetical protein
MLCACAITQIFSVVFCVVTALYKFSFTICNEYLLKETSNSGKIDDVLDGTYMFPLDRHRECYTNVVQVNSILVSNGQCPLHTSSNACRLWHAKFSCHFKRIPPTDSVLIRDNFQITI